MVLAKPIFDYVDALVHASVRDDALEAARHRSFIAPRLLASIIACALFPICIVASGAPGTIETLTLGLLAMPLFVACFLSRTGRLDLAQGLSIVCLSGLGAALAAAAGGIDSFAVVWLVLVPLEAACSGKPRFIVLACALTVTASSVLIVAQWLNLLPAPAVSVGPTAIGLLSAALYAAALAGGTQMIAGAAADALRAKDDAYQLLAGQMTDAVTRHGRNGAILFASPATSALFNAPVGDLLGGGLLDRIHAADRRPYLAALADASEFGHERSAEFRILRETNATGLADIAWVEMRCERLGAAGRPPNRPEVVAVMRDITVQKQQTATIESLRAVIDEANAASSVLLSLVSRGQAQTSRHVAAATDNRVRSSA